MNTKDKISQSKANKIYDLLVSIGGANERDRQDFVYHHCKDEYGCTEWRFCGLFGFGGKYRSTWNGVTYYIEDETPLIIQLKKELNKALKEIV